MMPRFLKYLTCSLLTAAFVVVMAGHADAAILQKVGNKLGLKGYWSLEDNSGVKATDFSGTSNTGTLNGNASWTAGRIGRALAFDGTGDYVQIADSTSLRFNANMTFSAWVFYNNRDAFDYILEKGQSDNDNYAFFTNGSGQLNMEFEDSGNTYRSFTDTTGVVPTGAWTHVAVVYDDTNNVVRFYINGSATASPATSFSLKGTQTTDLFIGRQNTVGSNLEFQGMIDEVRLYNRALSAAEIASLYNAGLIQISSSPRTLLDSGLIIYHTFDGAYLNSTTSTDSINTAYNGTLQSGPVGVIGKTGQGLNFDGVNDFVDVRGITFGNVELAYPLTFALWAKTRATTGLQQLFSQDSTTGHFQWFIDVDDKSLQFANPNVAGTSGAISNPQQWNHYAVTVTASGGLTFYVNGVSAGTASGIAVLGWNPPSFLRFGKVAADTTEIFNGIMDDVRIYNRALSSAEVSQLYTLGVATINKTPAAPFSTGLVFHHTFDGPRLNSTTSTDASTSGYNGTLFGSPVPFLGKVGQALQFDGVDARVDVGTSLASTFNTTSWSVAGWVKLASKRTKEIALCGNGTSRCFGYWQSADLFYAAEEAQALISGFSITTGEWTHFAFTYSGTTMTAYKNGVQADQDTYTFSTTYSGSYDIGRTSQTGSISYMAGMLDDIRVYNRPLSATEVASLYNATK